MTFKLLLLNSDRTTIMGGLLRNSRNWKYLKPYISIVYYYFNNNIFVCLLSLDVFGLCCLLGGGIYLFK